MNREWMAVQTLIDAEAANAECNSPLSRPRPRSTERRSCDKRTRVLRAALLDEVERTEGERVETQPGARYLAADRRALEEAEALPSRRRPTCPHPMPTGPG